jgi:Family of unknown function (DUF6134)
MRKSFFYWSFVFCYAAWFPVIQVTQGEDRPKLRVSNAANKSESVEIREFEVRVDNKPAGTHRLTIKSEGDTNQVAFQTDVKFDFVVYAYVFKFRGKEVWRDGILEQCDIRCEDGGKKRSMELKTDGKIQQISFNGKSVPAKSQCVMSTAYWRLPSEDLRNKPIPIVDVDTGITKSASLNVVGPTTISTSGRSLTCQHFKIDGPSPAELWFDDRDRLVRQKSVEQGHHMELRLKDIRVSKEDK